MGKWRRVVVKVGSSSLTDATGMLDTARMNALVCDLERAAQSAAWQLTLVSSGAVAAGSGKLGWDRAALSLPEKQAAAAVGQSLLMQTYSQLFAEHGRSIGQVLLTKFDIDDPNRFRHICDTMETLIAHGVVPVVNENDTVAVDEIRVGDNDSLAAHVAKLVHADLLVLLTDVDAYYTADPRVEPGATPILDVWEITEEMERSAGSAGSVVGTGGMQTKLAAARIATIAGVDVVLAKSGDPEVFPCLARGEQRGTWFHAGRSPAGDCLELHSDKVLSKEVIRS